MRSGRIFKTPNINIIADENIRDNFASCFQVSGSLGSSETPDELVLNSSKSFPGNISVGLNFINNELHCVSKKFPPLNSL